MNEIHRHFVHSEPQNDAEVEEQVRLGLQFMEEYRDAFAALAKNCSVDEIRRQRGEEQELG